jgi:hypothetical protein
MAGNVGRATTKIEDKDVSRVFGLLVKTVRDCRSEGLIHDAESIETGNDTSGLSLRIVTVGRHGDDGTCDGATEIRLCDLLHLGKDHRRYFFRRLEQLYEFTCDVGLSTRIPSASANDTNQKSLPSLPTADDARRREP